MKATALLFILLVSIFLMPVCDADEVAGQKKYDAMCKSCHGKTGEGNQALAKALKVEPVLLLINKLEASDDALAAVIKDGKGKMPSYKVKLSDDEIKSVIAYIRGFSQK